MQTQRMTFVFLSRHFNQNTRLCDICKFLWKKKCEEKKSLQFDLVTRTGFWEDIKWYEHFADNPGVIDKVVRDFSLYLSRHLFWSETPSTYINKYCFHLNLDLVKIENLSVKYFFHLMTLFFCTICSSLSILIHGHKYALPRFDLI